MIAIALLVAVVMFLYISIAGLPNYRPKKVDFPVEKTPEKIARGARLSSMICNHCHRSRTINSLTGRKVEDIDPAFGLIYSSNITNHPTAGIGSWSNGDLAYFLRTGIRPDGQYIPPYMPKFPLLSDSDLESIIAFLKSNHPMIQANGEEPPKSKPSFLTKFLTRIAFKPLEYPKASIQEPDTSNLIALGKYLATGQLGCFQCHSAKFQTNSNLRPEESKGFFGGGNVLYNLEGEKVLSPNITMDAETGIGSWSEQEFIQAVKWGKRVDKSPVRYPMLPYTKLTDKEVLAIFAYLKTVPTIKNDLISE